MLDTCKHSSVVRPAALVLLSMLSFGCRQDPNAVWESAGRFARPGETHRSVEAALGEWGHRHHVNTETSVSHRVWTEATLRDHIIEYHASDFSRLAPPDVLSTMPLGDGALVIERYAFNRRRKFAVGIYYDMLVLLYDGRTDTLLGRGLYHGLTGEDFSESKWFRGIAPAAESPAADTGGSN